MLLAVLPVLMKWAALFCDASDIPSLVYHTIEAPMIGLGRRLVSLWAQRQGPPEASDSNRAKTSNINLMPVKGLPYRFAVAGVLALVMQVAYSRRYLRPICPLNVVSGKLFGYRESRGGRGNGKATRLQRPTDFSLPLG